MTQPISSDQPISTRIERVGDMWRAYVDPAWFRYFVDVGEVDLAADVTGVLPVANGGTGIATLPTWAAVTFANGWANFGGAYDTCAYLKTWDGVVYLKGLMALGTVGLAAFTLPAGNRPSAAKIFAIASNGAYGQVQIDALGNVVVTVGSNVYASLEGISFRT